MWHIIVNFSLLIHSINYILQKKLFLYLKYKTLKQIELNYPYTSSQIHLIDINVSHICLSRTLNQIFLSSLQNQILFLIENTKQ